MPSDTSAAIGEYLLKGWAMLGDSCPQCCIPLLRSPDRVKMVCVGCNSEWPVDGAPKLTNGVTEKRTDCSERKCSGRTAQGEKKQRESQLRVEESKPKKEEIERKCTGWKQTAAGEEPNDYAHWRQLLEDQRLELQILRERRAETEEELHASVHQLYEREIRVIERGIHIIEDDIRRTRDELKEEASRDSQLQAGLMRLREQREREAAELRAKALEAEQSGE
ncbi:hypothetical protein FOZ60_007476 [Perkinsus olseni]|uniref:Uncharacterized protein n=1 Tax=Perkinsus olseni TaxID=32597 RepID=A0A7J6PP61_PEROL|nr:hypothetical protein FOZ60_007476 [Perkinsus olseni]